MKKTEIVDIPENFLIKNIVVDNNVYKNGTLEIDKCLVDEIKFLWWLGIHTRGCCCGHNKMIGFIQVERTDFAKMLALGYEWYHDYSKELGGIDRYDAFIPKSQCYCEIEDSNNEKLG